MDATRPHTHPAAGPAILGIHAEGSPSRPPIKPLSATTNPRTPSAFPLPPPHREEPRTEERRGKKEGRNRGRRRRSVAPSRQEEAKKEDAVPLEPRTPPPLKLHRAGARTSSATNPRGTERPRHRLHRPVTVPSPSSPDPLVSLPYTAPLFLVAAVIRLQAIAVPPAVAAPEHRTPARAARPRHGFGKPSARARAPPFLATLASPCLAVVALASPAPPRSDRGCAPHARASP